MAQEEQRLSGALQENILTLLCFDDTHCKLVRAAVTPHLFESSVSKEVAGHAIDFIDQYGEAIKEHLPDHLEDILQGDDERKAKTYRKLLDNLFGARDSVNGDYVISQLHKFVRQQNLKAGVIEAVEALEDGRIDDAELKLQKALTAQVISFEPGTSLDSAEDVAAILDAPEEEGFTLGIPALDDRGIIPRRKELYAFLAARGRGKSWFATHCAKRALLQRWSVLVVSLELSEKRYTARMLQSFFSISRRDARVKVTRLETNRNGDLTDMVSEAMERQTMRDPNIREVLAGKAKKAFRNRKPLKIKSFPSGSLTMSMLKAYIEGLKRAEGWTPDLLIVDYPRLFNLDAKNLRLELGRVNVEIRGLADELNCATVVLAQGNREAETAFLVDGSMVEEDISLKATTDVLITYSQTKAEKSLGLARLMADKARNDADGNQVLISQAYAVGQFCLDSVAVGGEYWDMLKERSPQSGASEGSDSDRRAGDRRQGERRRRVREEDGDARA